MKAVLIVSALLALLNAYLALSTRQKLASFSWSAGIVEALFLTFFALQLVAPWLDWSRTPIDHKWSGESYDLLVQSSYLALGVMSCLLVYSLCADILWFMMKWVLPTNALPFVRCALLGIVFTATAASLAAGLSDAGKMEVTRVDLPLKALPESFDGFTIAQISDIHVGPHLRRAFVQCLVDQVRVLSPDMIALTGDLADGTPAALAKDVAPLADLTAPFGAYYVTGNHEYYWGAELWVDYVKTLGFKPLMNEAVTFDRDGGSLAVVGIPDITAVRMGAAIQPDLEAAVKDVSPLTTKILLSHQPKNLDSVKSAGLDAQLAGHTHAGQYFPFTLIIKLFEPYTHGLYDLDGFKLYVNKGVGFWGPPLRSGGPGEITLITLRREL